jgi:hypothetical protein
VITATCGFGSGSGGKSTSLSSAVLRLGIGVSELAVGNALPGKSRKNRLVISVHAKNRKRFVLFVGLRFSCATRKCLLLERMVEPSIGTKLARKLRAHAVAERWQE